MSSLLVTDGVAEEHIPGSLFLQWKCFPPHFSLTDHSLMTVSKINVEAGKFSSTLHVSGIVHSEKPIDKGLMYVEVRDLDGKWIPIHKDPSMFFIEPSPWIFGKEFASDLGVPHPLPSESPLCFKVPLKVGRWTKGMVPQDVRFVLKSVQNDGEVCEGSLEEKKKKFEKHLLGENTLSPPVLGIRVSQFRDALGGGGAQVEVESKREEGEEDVLPQKIESRIQPGSPPILVERTPYLPSPYVWSNPGMQDCFCQCCFFEETHDDKE
jgi:hypothetical protein